MEPPYRSLPFCNASPFSQAFVSVSHQRREEITQKTTRASFYFNGHGHAGSQIDQSIVNLHLRTIKRYARGKTQILSFWFARRVVGTWIFFTGTVNRLIANDGVLRDTQDLAV